MGHLRGSKTEKPLSRLCDVTSSLVIDQGKGVLSEPSSRDVIEQVKSASPKTDMFAYTMSKAGQNIYLENEKYLCLERCFCGRQRWKESF